MSKISREIVIETAPCSEVPDRIVRLVEITAGQVMSGSSVRWQEHRWGVRFDEDGKVKGRQFRTLEDARTNFELLTAPRDDGELVTLAMLDAALEEDSGNLQYR